MRRAVAGCGLVLASWCMAGCATHPRVPARWDIVPAAVTDRVAAHAAPDSVIFDIESAKGIGSATVRLDDGMRPRTAWICFHLRGLEELRLEYGTTQIVASLSHTDPPRMRQELQRRGQAPRELTAADPCWLDWRVDVAAQIGPAPPERIWVAVPADFLHGDEHEFRLRWIDFYR
jgi:hypothetical protein